MGSKDVNDLGDECDLEFHIFFLGVDWHSEVFKLGMHEIHVRGADFVSHCEETVFEGMLSMLFRFHSSSVPVPLPVLVLVLVPVPVLYRFRFWFWL